MAGLLAVAGIAYAGLVVATYVRTSASNALRTKLSDLRRLAFHTEHPMSPMERRLEASDTPLNRPFDQRLSEQRAKHAVCVCWHRIRQSR